MTRHVLRISLAIMTTLLGLVVLWQFKVVVIYILASIMLAATLRPLVTRLRGRKWWERVGWVLLYLLGVVAAVFLFYLLGREVLVEIQRLATKLAVQQEWTLPAWLRGTMLNQVLFSRLLPPSKLFEIATFGQPGEVLPVILGFTQSVASMFSGVFIIIALSFFWILNKSHFERLWLSLLPSGQRKPARNIWQTIEPDLGAFIRSQLAINVLAGVLLGIGYWLIGSPYPALLAIIGALVTAIPFVGVIFAAILPLVFGLLAGMQNTFVIFIYTLAVLMVLMVWVKPRLFSNRWDNPILTLVLLLALSDAFGLVGLIVAPSISLIIQIAWSLLVTQRETPAQMVQASDFKQRQEKVWSEIKEMDQPPPQITSTMERLSDLLEKAEPILQSIKQEPSMTSTLPGTPASQQQE